MKEQKGDGRMSKEPILPESEASFWSIEALLSGVGRGKLSPEKTPRGPFSSSPRPGAGEKSPAAPSPPSGLSPAAASSSPGFSPGDPFPLGRIGASRAAPKGAAAGGGVSTRGTALGELAAAYSFSGGLLRDVEIYFWPSKYSFYEKFLAAARGIFPAKGEKCEFVPFFSFMPQYQQLSHAQLRFYLWWRENFRAGRAIPCDYCYLLLFIYEVLNLPDLLPPEKGAAQLAFLWASYRENFPRLDKYLGEWLPDYCLIHGVPCPRETIAPFFTKILAQTSIREFYVGEEKLHFSGREGESGHPGGAGGGSPFADASFVDRFLTYASGYDYRTSKYFAGDQKGLLSSYIPDAMRCFLMEISRKDPRFSSFFGETWQTALRDSYTGAVCAFRVKRQIKLTYLPLTGGGKQLSPVITDAVKYCENCVRAAMGINPRFRATHLTQEMKALLDRYFQKRIPASGRGGAHTALETAAYDALYEPLSEDISTEAAEKIELASRRAVTLLSLGEDDAPGGGAPGDADAFPGGVSDAAAASFESPSVLLNSANKSAASTGLSPAENSKDGEGSAFAKAPGGAASEKFESRLRPALEALLAGDGRAFRALAEREGMFPEMLAEEVNAAAIERLGDIVCENADGEYRLLEDYRKEAAGWLRGI